MPPGSRARTTAVRSRELSYPNATIPKAASRKPSSRSTSTLHRSELRADRSEARGRAARPWPVQCGWAHITCLSGERVDSDTPHIAHSLAGCGGYAAGKPCVKRVNSPPAGRQPSPESAANRALCPSLVRLPQVVGGPGRPRNNGRWNTIASRGVASGRASGQLSAVADTPRIA